MFLQNVKLNTYPYKEFIELFDKFPGEIYPWVGNFSEAPTGEKYVTVNADDTDEYTDRIRNTFSVCDERCVLYFRRLPSIQTYCGEPAIYSRFLISSKPVIQFANCNYNKED